MIPKIKKFYKENKNLVRIGALILIVLIVLLVVYKMLFYSNSEADIYGVRLRDIKEHEFTKKDVEEVEAKTSSIDGVKEADVQVKGRLIKFFVTFDASVSKDDIKNKFNETLGYMSKDVRGYYDITFYAKQDIEGTESYPVIGYKHKSKAEINFEVF